MSKQAGRMSQSANDFLEPAPITNLTVTDVGTARAFNNGAFDVTWTIPAGSPLATEYVFTTTPVSKTTSWNPSGPSTSHTIDGLSSNTDYTVTVVAKNAAGSSAGVTSSTVKATTAPATPSAPTVTAEASSAVDVLAWTIPSNGGKAIVDQTWESNDSKTSDVAANITGTSVSQEAGSTQKYRIRARNANGSGEWSAYSADITSFSFTPFSFTPFGFTPFNFVPSFGFAPFGFAPAYNFAAYNKSLGPDTLVLTTNGLTPAKNIVVGDTLVSVTLPGLDNDTLATSIQSWNVPVEGFSLSELTTTTVVNVQESRAEISVLINAELYSGAHFMLAKRDGIVSMTQAKNLLMTDELWSTASNTWVPITQLIIKPMPHQVISINCEPYDMFFTEYFLV